MVTIPKMKETKIGHRGSKSIKTHLIVKEQRVDGSCIGHPILRCALFDFERNYLIRIPFNQINLTNMRYYTSKAQLVNPCDYVGTQNIETPLNP